MKQSLVSFLRQALQQKTAIIGLSGGVDSAVVAYLLVQALDRRQIRGFYLPSATNAPGDSDHAALVAEQLGISYEAIPIDPLVAAYEVHLGELPQLALGNIKARIRMTILYAQANRYGGLVVGTGNKTELALGYFTKYGDGGIDLLPLAGLYKTHVWELAQELGVPEAIITKAPSAGLWDGQRDEDELGITYVMADQILAALDANQAVDQFDPALVTLVQQRMLQAQHKLHLPARP